VQTVNATLQRLYWQLSALLLAAHFAGAPLALEAAILLCTAQALDMVRQRRSLRAFPVQVRLAYLGLLGLGLWPPLAVLQVLQFVGVNAMLVADYCPLARLLVLMPWNRRVPFSLALLRWAAFSPPAPGAIVDRVPVSAAAPAWGPSGRAGRHP
jgi:hypothetical protein